MLNFRREVDDWRVLEAEVRKRDEEAFIAGRFHENRNCIHEINDPIIISLNESNRKMYFYSDPTY